MTIPTNKLLSTFNAQVWAEEFCGMFPQIDRSTMITWFSNAIMVGYDTAIKRGTPYVSLFVAVKRMQEDGHYVTPTVAAMIDAVDHRNDKG